MSDTSEHRDDGCGFICVLTTGEQRNPIGSALPMDYIIAIGFGSAVVCRDGEVALNGEDDKREDWLRLSEAEELAAASPDARWTVEIDGPLWSARWERQGPWQWVCTQAGDGFA